MDKLALGAPVIRQYAAVGRIIPVAAADIWHVRAGHGCCEK